MNRSISCLLSVLFLFVSGCGEEEVPVTDTEPEEGMASAEPPAPEQGEVSLPPGIPVPEDYVILSDREVGPARFVILEVRDDLTKIVERFEKELEASPHETAPFQVARTQDGLVHATTTVRAGEGSIAVTVSEYGEEGGLHEGNTGSVTYHITGM